MTDYEKPSFSVGVGSKKYRDNFDRIFKKKDEEKDDDTEAEQESEDVNDQAGGEIQDR